MARTRVGIKGSNRRRTQQRDEDSDESDEEYKVTDDEDYDESDESYSLDDDDSEEISDDFGKSRRVSRSRSTRRASSGKKVNETVKPRKRRRVSYTEDDDEDEDDQGADEDDVEFMSLDREANQVNKPMEKKMGSFTELDYNDDDYEDDGVGGGGGDDHDDDDDGGGGEENKEFVFSDGNRKLRKKPRENKRALYAEEDDDKEEEVVADEDDAEFTSLGRKSNQTKMHTETKMVSNMEMKDDDDGEEEEEDGYTEFVSFDGRAQRKKPQEDKVVCTENEEEHEYAEFVSSGRKRDHRRKHQENRVVYDDDDDDDDYEFAEFVSSDRNRTQRKQPRENIDDDDEYAKFVSSGRKRNCRKQPQEKTAVYTDDVVDDDDDDEYGEFMSYGRKGNQRKKHQEKRAVYTEDDDDDDEEDEDDDDDDDEEDDDEEFVSSGRRGNRRKKPQEKKVVYTEDEDSGAGDNDEFTYSSKKVDQKKNLRKKREVSYTEDDDGDSDVDGDDLGFMSTRKKRCQTKKRHEKRTVSYKEDNQEEEDENDAEFKLTDSDFDDFDDDQEDEIPKIKKTKVLRSHRQKNTRTKTSKTKNPTKLKQRFHGPGPKLVSCKQKSVTNKTCMENRYKISKKRKQRAITKSDSDSVNSASSDHEYTISEEEREQMREARVYCANLRAKQRSSTCGNQEKQPAHDHKKHPIRKGKEKIQDTDVGKQVCGICLSEEQKRTMRGVLDCCRHYFCFSCIMEWSKVESRCPLCKQRFTTITKAAKSDTGAFDSRTVVIPVPECDQVYEPSEEELRGYLDPYESVICTECQSGGDDALMLLCDICDSPAHTFCVGLGQEVPEGNWYCDGCRPTVFGTLNSSSSPVAGGFDLNELYVPETPTTQQTRVYSEPVSAPAGTAATTLRDRRRMHRQIHHRFLNNNRAGDLVGRSGGTSGSSSSSGIRLFGSQLDQVRGSVSQNNRVFPSVHESSNFYATRTDQFSLQVQNSNLGSADVSLQEFNNGFRADPPVH